MQKHLSYTDPFVKARRRPRTEDRDRFGGSQPDVTSWGAARPLDDMTREEFHGAVGLAAIRAIGWLTGLGATVAAVIAAWRLWTGA
ncbi:hypothetical protein [Muricoccus radiodurans]|uniref:hypothetical protein n=1 Tax=Muricoccus radiodurans TaxID=2231721 RepID=UPI003CF35C26